MNARENEGISKQFAAAPEVILVVDACHLEGRHERLEAMLTQLEMCEKALQVRPHYSLKITKRIIKVKKFKCDTFIPPVALSATFNSTISCMESLQVF